MRKLAKALEHAGYSVVNQKYPSTKQPVEVLAELAIQSALQKSISGNSGTMSKVHFVTHSMGGILVRQFLSRHSLNNLGRVVMLAPPNKGSQLADKLNRFLLYRWVNGPAGSQLGTTKDSLPVALGGAHYELGIIAGNRSINLLLSTLLPSPDDGKISVENTRLSGMKDHITLPVTHTFMMQNRRVISQVLHFLQYGKFATLDRKPNSQEIRL